MNLIVFLCTFAILQINVNCGTSYFAYDEYPTAYYKCLKQSGLKQIGVWLLVDNHGVKSQSVQNVMNAKNSGINVEVAYTPCRSVSPEVGVDSIIKNFGNKTVQRFWLFPAEEDPEQCDWTLYKPDQNCQYLQKFINLMKSKGLDVQIAGDRDVWTDVFKSLTACPEVNKSLLWWTPTDGLDNQPNFNSYKQIGGWTKPYMKMYSIQEICGQNLGVSYYE